MVAFIQRVPQRIEHASECLRSNLQVRKVSRPNDTVPCVHTFRSGEQNRPNRVSSQVIRHAEGAGVERQHFFEAHIVQTSHQGHPVANPLDDAAGFEGPQRTRGSLRR